ERHVACDHPNDRVGCGGDGRVESAQGAAARLEIGKERYLQEGVIFRTIGRHDQLIRNRSESFDHTLDQRASEKGLEGLVLSHAGGLSTGLNTNRKHLRYYKGGLYCRMPYFYLIWCLNFSPRTYVNRAFL